MRFSIIIPVYNVEEYLGQCLDSIAHQDYSDYEVVIVDDGSTDGSASIYERFAAEADVPVRIVKQENKGLLLARRAGIKAANGDYYWHVDGDDGLAPNAMCAVSGIIDELDPDVVLICLSESPTFGSVLPGGLPVNSVSIPEKALTMYALRSSMDIFLIWSLKSLEGLASMPIQITRLMGRCSLGKISCKAFTFSII